ncbi:hypothetical protein ILUMI_06983 [Ignelater luminosus]|uniref:Histone RNA hairpin-binding protein RNA-binding domain-containing protein n=1 Tax=Ignelater luminosus TaxID=2038154 RepID=A0A8K0D968_IGNLU|nr:hypothetical protein ILUMI_06983 [Ignelater luminosus]
MSENRRISMNTSLKNARIFDDDSWDTEQVNTKLKIKTEVEDEYEQIVTNATVKTEVQEPVVTGTIRVKSEFRYENMDFMHSDNAQFGDLAFNNFKNGQDVESNEENLYARQTEHVPNFNFTQEAYNGLIKNEMEENTNESTDSISNQSRKSARRTIFKRDSPYAKPEALYTRRDVEDNTKRNLFKRDGPYGKPKALYTRREPKPSPATFERVEVPSSSQPQRSNSVQSNKGSEREYETDSRVLARRQKQIDFGKNTVGYDNYIRTVPKDNRKADDPATPNRHMKYSRRAWDGLIKQWRLRLHKYDPDDAN